MRHEPTHRPDKPKHSAEDVARWIAFQRENKLTMNKLAKHLGKGFLTVQTYIEKYEAGLLK